MKNNSGLVKRISLMLFAMILMVISSVGYASVSALVDKSTLTMDDLLSLTVAVDGNSTGAKPDVRKVLDDFDIVGTSVSTNMSIINGNATSRKEWRYQLVPRRTGQLIIPAIDVAGERTQPLPIEVLEQVPSAVQEKKLFVEVEIKPEKVYVQSQIHLVQRVFSLGNFPAEARLTSPEITEGEAEIIELGQRQPFRVSRQGVNYQVVERHLVVYPQKSGKLSIAPTVFHGYVTDNSGTLKFPFTFRGKRVRARSNAVDINVLRQPAHFSGKDWLPAQNVTLHGNWSTSIDQLKTGEPVTLTLGIKAEGVRAEQLPDVQLILPDHIKVYPEPAVTQNNKGQRSLVGVKNQKFTLIPSKSGEFTLPEISIPWWDVTNDKQQKAVLESRVLMVTGDPVTLQQDKEEEKTTPDPVQKIASNVSDTLSDNAKHIVNDESGAFSLGRTLLGLLALLSMLGAVWLLFFYKGKGQRQDSPNSNIKGRHNTRHRENGNMQSQSSAHDSSQQMLDFSIVKQQLQRACERNDPDQASRLVQQWAEHVMQLKPATLSAIAEAGSADLSEAVHGLSAALYGRKVSAWDGSMLWQAVSGFRQASKKQRKPALEPMYPL